MQVWVHLIESQLSGAVEIGDGAVNITRASSVDALRDAILIKFGPMLKGVAAPQLAVKPSKDAPRALGSEVTLADTLQPEAETGKRRVYVEVPKTRESPRVLAFLQDALWQSVLGLRESQTRITSTTALVFDVDKPFMYLLTSFHFITPFREFCSLDFQETIDDFEQKLEKDGKVTSSVGRRAPDNLVQLFQATPDGTEADVTSFQVTSDECWYFDSEKNFVILEVKLGQSWDCSHGEASREVLTHRKRKSSPSMQVCKVPSLSHYVEPKDPVCLLGFSAGGHSVVSGEVAEVRSEDLAVLTGVSADLCGDVVVASLYGDVLGVVGGRAGPEDVLSVLKVGGLPVRPSTRRRRCSGSSKILAIIVCSSPTAPVIGGIKIPH